MQIRILLPAILVAFFSAKAIAQNRPAMNEPYAVQWKMADSLIGKSLPQSARRVVDKVYSDAQRTNQAVQMLKAQLYFLRIDATNNEAADSLNIARAEAQSRIMPFPQNALWQSIAAQLYWHYYQDNRYKILDRTPTTAAVGSDFGQWDAANFFEKTSALYLQSISRAEDLKRINIEAYDPVLIKGENTRSLRPTLFDLLAFRAIDFFENDEKDLTKPAFQFVMDDPAVFSQVRSFMLHPFATRDSTSMQYRALQLYQEVLRLHQNDASPDAFIDADLQRLQIAYAHSVDPEKRALFIRALTEIEQDYPGNPLSAMASFRIAELMMNEPEMPYNGSEGDDAGQKSKTDLRPIKAKLDAIIAKYPKSEGGIASRQLLQGIAAPSLSLTAEEAVLPAEPSKILVTYKNVPKAYIRVVRMYADNYLTDETRNGTDKFLKPLLSAQPVEAFSVALPGTEDFAQHRTEVKINPLPLGMYVILISAKSSFAKEDNALSYAICQSTRMAVVGQNGSGASRAKGYVLDRKVGTPVANATLAFYRHTWNSTTRAYSDAPFRSVVSGADGTFPTPDNEWYNNLQVKKDSDIFFTNSPLSVYSSSGDQPAEKRCFFFTDRSIYRPGQTIFFKGILVYTDKNGLSNETVSNQPLEVTFYDANGQKVASQMLTTNEWGSIAGSFTAPQNGLTGMMSLQCPNGNVDFSVEEYKRPKFRVEWDTLKSDYALNEPVVVTGHALAYAGNNVDGATVKYRVVRNVRWPFWWYAWRYSPDAERSRSVGGEQEIAQGTATTDADGKFIIHFQTLPDRSIDERSLPVFTYTVYADVTDLNGETRSGEQSIAAGYRSLQIVANIPEQASRKDLDTVRITTQNLNGDFVAASVNIRMARLAPPDVIYRKRLWPVPDQFTMSEAEFRKAFPLDAYKDEDDYRKWKEASDSILPKRISGRGFYGQWIYERSLVTEPSGIIALPTHSSTFYGGWYCITISATDKNGRQVEEKKFVQVWDEDSWDPPYDVLKLQLNNIVVEPGASTQWFVATGNDEIHYIRQVQTMDGTVKATQRTLNAIDAGDLYNSWIHSWSQPITEADRGGIALSYITVKDNRVYTASARIDVPWTNKELSIEWETHRAVGTRRGAFLRPGEQETWTMIVRGAKKDMVAAELAATLYDASLDAFKPHGWEIPGLFPSLNAQPGWETHIGFGETQGLQLSYFNSPALPSYNKRYDQLIFADAGRHSYRYMYADGAVAESAAVGNFDFDAPNVRRKSGGAMPAAFNRAQLAFNADTIAMEDPITGSVTTSIARRDKVLDASVNAQNADIPIRKNLQETAFFYPQLHTDAEGAVRIQFTIPEALTEWKLLAFAHTKDMRTGITTGKVKTQKDLMVQPGLPRFLRQGDEIALSTKIVNLSNAALSGTATLEIVDALTGMPIPLPFRLTQASVPFHAAKGGSTSASWTIHVPESRYEPVIIRILAKSGAFTDGEESMLPVLTNRMLVTETMPLWMNSAGTKTFRFDKLLQSGESKTVAPHGVTLEYTANPAWYAVQALPYLMEYPYECAEQTFNRYYANALAAHILEKSPRVKKIFKEWENWDLVSTLNGRLTSKLEENQELKSALLEETPWVFDARSEVKQQYNIALLFQTAKLTRELDQSAKKLEDMMLPEGGWPWFKGDAQPDRYITQYIVTGIGRLQHLGARNPRLASLTGKAIPYLDRKMTEDYKTLLRQKANLKEQHIGYPEVQYLYMRSFFADVAETEISAEAKAFYKKQARQFWPQFNSYLKGMIALALDRNGDKETPKTIIQSLKETAIEKEETGMYWMDRGRSWYWWEAPVEAQSLLIECFSEVANDHVSIDKMKRWLLKQKQTQSWPTTKATADACYALLLQGTQWLDGELGFNIQFGEKVVRSEKLPKETGTGYTKIQVPASEVRTEMGNIKLTVYDTVYPHRELEHATPSWGAMYWQYFENLDKITSAATPLIVKKQLFIERNTDHGPLLEPLSGNASLKIGDLVKARIEIIVDRDMEYVHLKDGRASCFEPVNVLSGYRWQGDLGYYESTRDASSNFFFSYLPKGKYVFEYPMFVTSGGDFSDGIATIQCMYAPEFSAHSEGVRVTVK